MKFVMQAAICSETAVESAPHVSWELFRAMTGTRMLHVPYRGGAPAINALLGQQVQVYFFNIAEAMEHIKAGRLRALAVTGAARAQALPDVPSIGEFVPGYAIGVVEIGVPAGERCVHLVGIFYEFDAARLHDCDYPIEFLRRYHESMMMGVFAGIVRIDVMGDFCQHKIAAATFYKRIALVRAQAPAAEDFGIELRSGDVIARPHLDTLPLRPESDEPQLRPRRLR